jgi:outer membrane protein assembly factor BamB
MNTAAVAPSQPPRSIAPLRKPLRLWYPAALVIAYWVAFLVLRQTELTTVVRFMSGFGSSILLTILFISWWLISRRVPRREKWAGFAALVGGSVATILLARAVTQPMLLMWMALPVVLTAWVVWLALTRRATSWRGPLPLAAIILLAFVPFTVIRVEGTNGEQRASIAWRWSRSAEDTYLLQRTGASTRPTKSPDSAAAVALGAGDWPGFRGPQRDGVVHGLRIATDWNASPPKQRWRRRVGPGWSSVAVVGGRVFTQEQRGDVEAVVCLDAETGAELWSAQDPARFWESVSGAGPRATPTFDSGRVYAMGARGRLNCLDAATGARVWSRDAAADAGGTPVQPWGLSGSPLVTDGVVIVFAGGDGKASLRAYRADTGEPAWAAPAGTSSYTSPQLATVCGQRQVLFLSDTGLAALDPASGAVRWTHSVPLPNAPRNIQPHVLGADQVLLSSETDVGTRLLAVAHSESTSSPWSATPRWTSRAFNPSFNDFVVVGDSAFGFDRAVFCCLDLTTGKRHWREGDYGHGQVVLLADQSLLLVLGEQGELVLLAGDPGAHRELARVQAINGKTWNHPAVAQGRLYVRNAEEMACYELPRDAQPK